MGQQASNLMEYIPSFPKLISAEASKKFVYDELIIMSYEDFLIKLGELNKLASTCLDSSENKLLFAVKKGTDQSVLWKATVQIACVKLDSNLSKVHNYRLLSLKEFLQVFHTLRCQYLAAEESKKQAEQKLTATTLYDDISEISKNSLDLQSECCICFDRKPNISLPCAHSYCLTCIEEWNEDHHSCPICREKVNSTDESWVISEVPGAEEISEVIRTTLLNLPDEKPSSACKPS